MKENVVKVKSFAFAVRIVRLYQFLCSEKKEFVLSKQLLRSGTSVGVMVREAEHAESKADFKHKMGLICIGYGCPARNYCNPTNSSLEDAHAYRQLSTSLKKLYLNRVR